ncbi:putative small auxin-up RNA [Arabidopsis thaliana]|uniref:SAUR-like auxin-responsive protein family n=1 Tax=Arabidopsis thaliana TaxID=3702 RepID=Q9M275_ARATH|nr:SAUR-like auxin-responsive protein family [Arabidopsis thaliana]AEE80277.1 SAUR-like auxin-responsive protein family [Arabidopsis thaliana]CAB71897.1 putative protein [Arabidopsis thaliana]|eukprot:NP_191749.1 SAUR-like auxin-responsive protein family [Arabidopsis thaliana]
MGSGEKILKSVHSNRPNNVKSNSKHGIKDVPKGCLAIKVGSKEEEKQRFVVPVFYFNHPLFMQLLREAEEEYGFEQKGTITIPCHVEVFRYVQDMINRERSLDDDDDASKQTGCGAKHGLTHKIRSRSSSGVWKYP